MTTSRHKPLAVSHVRTGSPAETLEVNPARLELPVLTIEITSRRVNKILSRWASLSEQAEILMAVAHWLHIESDRLLQELKAAGSHWSFEEKQHLEALRLKAMEADEARDWPEQLRIARLIQQLVERKRAQQPRGTGPAEDVNRPQARELGSPQDSVRRQGAAR